MRLAVEPDRLSVAWRAVTASHLVHAGMFDEAIAEVKKAIDMDPHNGVARFILVEAYLETGPLARVMAAAEQAYEASPWYGNCVAVFAGLLAQAGQAARGEELMHEVGHTANAFCRVFYHVLRSELEQAAEWYEKSIERRELFALICAKAPITRALRESPYWPRLSKLMKLPA